jgi:iron complex outermembrane recepter protein
MKTSFLMSASALAMFVVAPAFAQAPPATQDMASETTENDGITDIVVTAQRRSESLQNVPIAVSAFSGQALESQQIKNANDLQLTLPNVVFSKGNFATSSFTVRGIGDLCVGNSCDSATAIHVNGSPLRATRLFETEYFDLERVEVLRGPQGTLFGRNATSGVVNFITAKPEFDGIHVSAEGEYGNYESIRAKGMINVPIADNLAVRLAGTFLKRDGYTKNLFNNTRIDGREQYAFRGSLRWEPSNDTVVDLMGYYFREKDDRLRIQKQLCQRDPTGVLGCLPGRRDYGTVNGNSLIGSILSSREFLGIAIPTTTLFRDLGLGSVYGPDIFANAVNPANPRQVNTDYTPTYFADEKQFQAHIKQNIGSFELNVSGLYSESSVDSSQDYGVSVASGASYTGALATLAGVSAAPGVGTYFAPIRAALNPSAGIYCTSRPEPSGTGVYGGNAICSATPQDIDRSDNHTRTWSVETILTSKFDGPFNFLLGGIYLDSKTTDSNYYISSFGIDYFSAILGAATGLGGLAPGYLATPYFRTNDVAVPLRSYGLFGEAYYDATDRLKLTLGLRYNNDRKGTTARNTFASFYVPYRTANVANTIYGAGYDADPATACPTNDPVTGLPNPAITGPFGSVAGCEAFQVRKFTFSAWTGRAVLDYKISDDSLVYASYSRGYKSGGVNPPLSPVFSVPESYNPEFINSFEIGSKNTFAGGKFRFNLTGFYYQYKALQLSRIVGRTAVNDNVDANIYGIEADAVFRPSRSVQINMGASYLKTKVSSDKFLGNPRDPSGGRSDAVIIKDVTNVANCAVIPTTPGNAAGTNTLVAAINGSLGLNAPVAFPAGSGLAPGTTGAFGICSALQGAIAAPGAGLRALFATPTGALPFSVESSGVPVNIRGNQLPQAPTYKFSVGVQYTAEFAGGMSLVPRFDLTYTGESSGSIFNGTVNRIEGYAQMNAQIQLNGRDDRWFARAFIQNIDNNSATTGLYVTDQSSGLFTNIFTLEPRRFGIAAGVKF